MSRKKLLSSLTAVAVAATVITPVASAAQFKDTAGHKYEKAIEGLFSQGIVSGYPDNTYKPNKSLTRSDVVKLLGKYLVSLGYQIPHDYAYDIRFSDLTAKTDDELLQYAALVYDHGIFNGTNGKLNPNNFMSLEHMALVMVRALSSIDEFDYIEYVEGQKYMQEYVDIEKATAEAQRAINVFDYYDITIEDYYRPKATATRGEFAHFLYGMLNIESPARNNTRPTLSKVNVVSATRLDVTLSNGTTHHIQLEEPLKENVPTEVDITVNGLTFTETVVYSVKGLQILDAENINAGQFIIYFNQPVNLSTTFKQSDLAKFFKLSTIDNNYYNSYYNYYNYYGNIPLKQGELSEDGRSYKVTVAQSTPLNMRYRLQIQGIHSKDGLSMPEYDDVLYFGQDTTPPEIIGAESITQNRATVYFSEPVNFSNVELTTASGQRVTNYTYYEASPSETTGLTNVTQLTFNLENARTNYGSVIAKGEPIYVTISNVRDVANNYAYTLSTSIVKGQQNGIAPTLETVKQLGAKQFKLTFNEELERFSSYDLLVKSDSTSYYVEKVEPVEGDPLSYIVTVNDFLRGKVLISTAPSRFITDLSGEVGTFGVNHTFDYDAGTAKIVKTEVIRENNLEYLFIEFDRNVSIDENSKASISGTYTANRRTIPINSKEVKVRRVYGESNVVRIALRELLQNVDIENTTYNVNINFRNVENEYKVAVENGPIAFTRSKDYTYNGDKLEVVAVNTSRTTSAIQDPRVIVVDFNYPVNETYAAFPYYYQVEGYEIEQVQVNPSNTKQVRIKLGTQITKHAKPYIYITKLRAANSYVEMDYYYEPIYLTESIAPVPAPTWNNWTPTLAMNHGRELVLSFDEAIAPIGELDFIVTDNYGTDYNAVATNDPTDARKIKLTLSKDVTSGATVTVRLKPNRQLFDVYGNSGQFDKAERTFYTIPEK
ncbi:MAG: S-layer homology domain-containing protein [Lysinibacillus sp.]